MGQGPCWIHRKRSQEQRGNNKTSHQWVIYQHRWVWKRSCTWMLKSWWIWEFSATAALLLWHCTPWWCQQGFAPLTSCCPIHFPTHCWLSRVYLPVTELIETPNKPNSSSQSRNLCPQLSPGGEQCCASTLGDCLPYGFGFGRGKISSLLRALPMITTAIHVLPANKPAAAWCSSCFPPQPVPWTQISWEENIVNFICQLETDL